MCYGAISQRFDTIAQFTTFEKKYNKETIQILYGIPVFKLIDEQKYDEAVNKFFEFYNRDDVDFNYTSSLKRFLNIGFDKFNISNQNRLKSIITEYQFVRESNEFYMKKIYKFIKRRKRRLYKANLQNIKRNYL